MKKITAKKLSVSTVTVAVLTGDQLTRVGGGMMMEEKYTKGSVCVGQCCKSDYCGGSSGC